MRLPLCTRAVHPLPPAGPWQLCRVGCGRAVRPPGCTCPAPATGGGGAGAVLLGLPGTQPGEVTVLVPEEVTGSHVTARCLPPCPLLPAVRSTCPGPAEGCGWQTLGCGLPLLYTINVFVTFVMLIFILNAFFKSLLPASSTSIF